MLIHSLNPTVEVGESGQAVDRNIFQSGQNLSVFPQISTSIANVLEDNSILMGYMESYY